MIGRSDQTFLFHALNQRGCTVIANAETALDVGGGALLVAHHNLDGLFIHIIAIFGTHRGCIENRRFLRCVFFFLVFGIVQLDLQFPSRFTAAVAALGLYTSAFVCEAVRSGINAVPPGQAEAARALGMSRAQAMLYIILPRAARIGLPGSPVM